MKSPPVTTAGVLAVSETPSSVTLPAAATRPVIEVPPPAAALNTPSEKPPR